MGAELRLALGRAENALDLSLRLNDAEAFWFIASAVVSARIPQYSELRKRLSRRDRRSNQGGCPSPRLGLGATKSRRSFLGVGTARNNAIETGQELKELAERTGQGNAILLSMEWQANLATINGRLEEAAAIAGLVPARGEELGIPAYAALVESQLSSIYILLGDLKKIERRKPGAGLTAPTPPTLASAGRGRCCYRSG